MPTVHGAMNDREVPRQLGFCCAARRMQHQSVIWRPLVTYPPHPVSGCIAYLITPLENSAPSLLGTCLNAVWRLGPAPTQPVLVRVQCPWTCH